MQKSDVLEFWGFVVRERVNLWRFLKWASRLHDTARDKPKNP